MMMFSGEQIKLEELKKAAIAIGAVAAVVLIVIAVITGFIGLY